MIRRPPRSTQSRSSAASDVYKRQIVVNEQKMVEWGKVARDMLGRVPENIEVTRPLQHGVIADYEITENLLKSLIKKVSGPMLFFRPRIMITVPYGVTSVESRAVREAGLG